MHKFEARWGKVTDTFEIKTSSTLKDLLLRMVDRFNLDEKTAKVNLGIGPMIHAQSMNLGSELSDLKGLKRPIHKIMVIGTECNRMEGFQRTESDLESTREAREHQARVQESYAHILSSQSEALEEEKQDLYLSNGSRQIHAGTTRRYQGRRTPPRQDFRLIHEPGWLRTEAEDDIGNYGRDTDIISWFKERVIWQDRTELKTLVEHEDPKIGKYKVRVTPDVLGLVVRHGASESWDYLVKHIEWKDDTYPQVEHRLRIRMMSEAARYGRLSWMEMLMTVGTRDSFVWTIAVNNCIMVRAIRGGHKSVVQWLLSQCPFVTPTNLQESLKMLKMPMTPMRIQDESSMELYPVRRGDNDWDKDRRQKIIANLQAYRKRKRYREENASIATGAPDEKKARPGRRETKQDLDDIGTAMTTTSATTTTVAETPTAMAIATAGVTATAMASNPMDISAGSEGSAGGSVGVTGGSAAIPAATAVVSLRSVPMDVDGKLTVSLTANVPTLDLEPTLMDVDEADRKELIQVTSSSWIPLADAEKEEYIEMHSVQTRRKNFDTDRMMRQFEQKEQIRKEQESYQEKLARYDRERTLYEKEKLARRDICDLLISQRLKSVDDKTWYLWHSAGVNPPVTCSSTPDPPETSCTDLLIASGLPMFPIETRWGDSKYPAAWALAMKRIVVPLHTPLRSMAVDAATEGVVDVLIDYLDRILQEEDLFVWPWLIYLLRMNMTEIVEIILQRRRDIFTAIHLRILVHHVIAVAQEARSAHVSPIVRKHISLLQTVLTVFPDDYFFGEPSEPESVTAERKAWVHGLGGQSEYKNNFLSQAFYERNMIESTALKCRNWLGTFIPSLPMDVLGLFSMYFIGTTGVNAARFARQLEHWKRYTMVYVEPGEAPKSNSQA